MITQMSSRSGDGDIGKCFSSLGSSRLAIDPVCHLSLFMADDHLMMGPYIIRFLSFLFGVWVLSNVVLVSTSRM